MASLDDLSFLLSDAARLLKQNLEGAFETAGYDLSVGDLRVLTCTAPHTGSRQKVIAARIGVEPMTVSGFADRLEARALLRREIDPDDKRARTLHVTPEATNVVEQLQPVTAMVCQRAMKGLEPDQVRVLRASLAIMLENLRA